MIQTGVKLYKYPQFSINNLSTDCKWNKYGESYDKILLLFQDSTEIYDGKLWCIIMQRHSIKIVFEFVLH